MDYSQGDVEVVQWTLSSPTSCASPIEFAVGSSQWSLKPIADSSCRQNLSIAEPKDTLLETGPQWTFQHVDSTFRNTILSHTSRLSDSGPTPFPISRKPSLPSSSQRPSIIVNTPETSSSEMSTRAPVGSTTPMFPSRERVHGLDSPILGLFDTLLPLSPALSSSQLRLVPPRTWPSMPNSHLQRPLPPAGSGTSTPRPPFVLPHPAGVEPSVNSEIEETPSLRQTLDSLDQRLCALLEERMLVQNRLAHAASRLSPISRLPLEIIARIFECGINAGGRSGLGTGTHGLFMGAVRRVCKLWRGIAESTPCLWSSIVIDMHNSLENTKLRLQRSRCAPLDIQVVFTDRVTGADSVTNTLMVAFDLLRPHMQRWRSLRVQVPGYAHARAVLSSFSGSAPRLQEFSLHVSTPKVARNIRELPWMLEETTSLTALSLSSVDFGWDNAAAYFRSLSSIYLSDYWASSAPSSLQLLCLFDVCSANLTDLTLRNMSDCDTEEEQTLLDELRYVPQIALPRLKRATFYFSGCSRLSVLLSRLALPALEYLEMSYLDDVSIPVGMLCEQKDGNLPLETLVINSSLIVEEQLVQLLHKVPGLTSLELVDCEDVSPFLLNTWRPLREPVDLTSDHHVMLRALVDYGDESDDENTRDKRHSKARALDSCPTKRKNDLPHQPSSPPKKARALPLLDPSLFTPAPVDDPSKHQGRKRTIPYVEGQFIAHVYVPLKLEGELLALLRCIVECAQSDAGAWHSLLEHVSGTAGEQTPAHTPKFRSHLSLSRPVPLRAHQRDGFRKEVRKAALERTQFLASFAQLTTLTNEDQSRTFLCVEIGAGHNEFQALSQSLSAHLVSLRQLPYYPQPRFHISIAWILTHGSSFGAPVQCDQGFTSPVEGGGGTLEQTSEPNIYSSTSIASLVEKLQTKFSSQLLELGKFDVQGVERMESPREAAGERLPFAINLPSGFDVARIEQYVSELKAFLTSPLVESLVSAHPNEVAIKGEPDSYESDGSWWEWTGQVDPGSRAALINSLILSATDQATQEDIELHPSLRQLIGRVAQLRLPRTPEDARDIAVPDGHRNTGMSPKKAHEVDRLSNLIDIMYNTSIRDLNRLIVDVGAGQGYLSHRLAEHIGTRVLALDGDEGQTEGATLRGKGLSHAERQRARNVEGSPADGGDSSHLASPVAHRTLFITSDSLLHAVDEWIGDLDFDQETSPHPVLITGLHACGSLTPAVLRCFVDLCARVNQKGCDKEWMPVALALVGCCYNLMRNADDFPLSATTARVYAQVDLHLSQNHLQLAAQCPAQWSRSESEMKRAGLARRKIVWRAILARSIRNTNTYFDPDNKPPNRLGRLPDRVYANWESFVRIACEKMGLPSATTEALLSGSSTHESQSTLPLEAEILSFQLEVLHILRALIGPVIESLIIVDRILYLAEQLSSSNGSPTSTVRALNLFDQLSSGSARNIALIVEPINRPATHI
ncbi:unnamed protein product [Rhizoctonia solani]|uniref:Methyltransferase domain-containing protein n=1 Tax=Rhizoctonia solani TaxID=456999 RepID=A0A8H3GRN9_9AGAM|nr:unnamed protein product [Rhizoctonia solani]